MKKVPGTCSPRGREEARIIRTDDLLNLSAARSIGRSRAPGAAVRLNAARLVLEKIGSRDVIENIMEQLYAIVEGWGEDISASEGYLRATTQKEREVVTSETIVSLDPAPNPVDPATRTLPCLPSISLHPLDHTVMRLKRLARIGVVCRCKMGSGCLPWH